VIAVILAREALDLKQWNNFRTYINLLPLLRMKMKRMCIVLWRVPSGKLQYQLLLYSAGILFSTVLPPDARFIV